MKNATVKNAVVSATPYRGQESVIAVLFGKANTKAGIKKEAAVKFLVSKKVKHPDQMLRHISGGQHRGFTWKVFKSDDVLKVSDVKAPIFGKQHDKKKKSKVTKMTRRVGNTKLHIQVK